jgi:hypothetical protein
MGGVVGEIETTLQRIRFVFRVDEAFQPRLLEGGELLRIGRFLPQGLAWPTEVVKR